MPSFDFQSLLWWGLPLVAAPVIIHLINLLRHKRIKWAAMEFLLASQRKYRTRVLLKQFLLLMARVAA
ncbi:MAG: BatA domain-containing protein, partial [Planctomycetia bacterium]